MRNYDKMSNKSYGLGKERELKKLLYKEGAMFVSRSRGSFGAFDLEAYFPTFCLLVSCKATRRKYASYQPEIRSLLNIDVPQYCQKQLRIYWSPKIKRKSGKKGWEIINIVTTGHTGHLW